MDEVSGRRRRTLLIASGLLALAACDGERVDLGRADVSAPPSAPTAPPAPGSPAAATKTVEIATVRLGSREADTLVLFHDDEGSLVAQGRTDGGGVLRMTTIATRATVVIREALGNAIAGLVTVGSLRDGDSLLVDLTTTFDEGRRTRLPPTIEPGEGQNVIVQASVCPASPSGSVEDYRRLYPGCSGGRRHVVYAGPEDPVASYLPAATHVATFVEAPAPPSSLTFSVPFRISSVDVLPASDGARIDSWRSGVAPVVGGDVLAGHLHAGGGTAIPPPPLTTELHARFSLVDRDSSHPRSVDARIPVQEHVTFDPALALPEIEWAASETGDGWRPSVTWQPRGALTGANEVDAVAVTLELPRGAVWTILEPADRRTVRPPEMPRELLDELGTERLTSAAPVRVVIVDRSWVDGFDGFKRCALRTSGYGRRTALEQEGEFLPAGAMQRTSGY